MIIVPYCLPVFKTSGDYLRLTRNGSLLLRCPASLKRQLDKCDSLLFVGDFSLTRFVIVGFSFKPYYIVYGLFKYSGKVSEIIKMSLRMKFHRHLEFGDSLLSPVQKRALDAYLDGRQISLFS